MNLIAVGVNHKTAPIEIREQLWLSIPESKQLLTSLVEGGIVAEAVVISTCNRTELFAVPKLVEADADFFKRFLIEHKGARKEVKTEHFFSLFACGAAKHFFEVAAATDSMIIGDAQILGQVKDAYRLAAEAGATGTVLNHLCHAAFAASKRVRSETELTDGAVSISYAAVELARKIFSDLSSKHILIIGAGETAELAAKHLIDKNAAQISITNRTPENAVALSERLNTACGIVPFAAFAAELHKFDIVISAVSNAGTVVSAAELDAAMRLRQNKAMLVLDIGLPRNIDPNAAELYNVFLKDIDDLNIIVGKNLERRRAELPKVAVIVEEELIAFERWHHALQAVPTIKQLQEKFNEIKTTELEKLKGRVSGETYLQMELFADRLIKKILHYPMQNLKLQTGVEQDLVGKLSLIRSIFNLEE
ncbi:MAG: glutamyl-tRNA reductase [Rhizobacter sp.]|nr:glutamyl-tRNA reductase [Chlorobiales bacterium]